MNKIPAIVLAAGRGKRMGLKNRNKVTLSLAEVPLIVRQIGILKQIFCVPIVIIVGFAKDSVKKLVAGVEFVEQPSLMGTANAVLKGIGSIPQKGNVLVLNGDGLYSKETIESVIDAHCRTNAHCTFLTVVLENPLGIGRVIRDQKENVIAIIEEKDLSIAQKKNNEVNAGCYVFDISFLRYYLPQIKKNRNSGEYYLTDIVALGIKDGKKIQAVSAGKTSWAGINTPEELNQAQRVFSAPISKP